MDGAYAIYALDAVQATAPVRLARVNAAVLPPERAATASLARTLEDPARPLLSQARFDEQDYTADLSLQHVGASAPRA
jgi:hypothetical protein